MSKRHRLGRADSYSPAPRVRTAHGPKSRFTQRVYQCRNPDIARALFLPEGARGKEICHEQNACGFCGRERVDGVHCTGATAVMGSDDQKIGDVSDILFDKMGHVKAYIVSVGGILGIGAKEVALEQSAFREMPVIEGRTEEKQFLVPRLQVSMTKDQLKQMAAFKALPSRPSTTGVAPAAPPADK
jgi:hypothetical protein